MKDKLQNHGLIYIDIKLSFDEYIRDEINKVMKFVDILHKFKSILPGLSLLKSSPYANRSQNIIFTMGIVFMMSFPISRSINGSA